VERVDTLLLDLSASPPMTERRRHVRVPERREEKGRRKENALGS
jgi:hypothetical protein